MDANDVDEVIGSDAYDPDGAKVGRIGQVYFDDATDEPTWAAVTTGLFGTRESLVPLDGAGFDGDRLTLAHPKSRIQDAPNVAADDHLTPEEEEQLYDYYGVNQPADLDRIDPTGADHETAGSAPGEAADGTLTRSEERLQIGTTPGIAGRARLRKYVVIEQEQVTVPVRREKVVLETEGGEAAAETPAGAAAVAGGLGDGDGDGVAVGVGDGIGDPDGEMILHEERPVVSTETVPVERVRLGTVEETLEQRVTAPVRKEHVAVEEDVPPSPTG